MQIGKIPHVSHTPTKEEIDDFYRAREEHYELIRQFEKSLDEEASEEYEAIRSVMKKHNKNLIHGFDMMVLFSSHGNYLCGRLNAIQKSGSNIGAESVRDLVDFYYTLGFSRWRILFEIHESGFVDRISHRLLTNYIKDNRTRLDKLRKDFMNSLTKAKESVFQEIKDVVMDEERKQADTLLVELRAIQEHLKTLCPIKDSGKYQRFQDRIDDLLKKLKNMSGITDAREIHKEVTKGRVLFKEKKKIESGFLDLALKNEADAEMKEAMPESFDENGQLRDAGEQKVLDV